MSRGRQTERVASLGGDGYSRGESSVAELADRLWRAFQAREPVEPLTTAYPALSLADAYAIQLHNAFRRQAAGARRAGFKIGVTSRESQARFGVSHPDFGHLFQDSVYADGETVVVSQFIHPQLEIEVGLLLGRSLRGPGVTPEQARRAVEWVAPCFELIDSRLRDWRGSFVDSIADNAFAAGAVVSRSRKRLDDVELAGIEVAVFANNRHIGRASPGTGFRDPLIALSWLANALSLHGLGLEAGDLVLSGSLMPPLHVESGLTVRAYMDAVGPVTSTFQGEAKQ